LIAHRTVLVAGPQGIELTTELERQGARVIVSPSLKISPPESYAALDEAIENLYGYDWLVFTNANSVEYFLSRFQQLGRETNDLDALRVCAIGEITSRRLEDSQVHVDLIPEQFKSEVIFAALARYAGGPEKLGRLNFLIPRATRARDRLAEMLEEAGARVDVVVAYRTGAPPNTKLTNINALLAGGGIDCVAFLSASAVEDFAQFFDTNDLSEFLKGVAVACFDDDTAQTALQFDLQAGIAPIESTIAGLAGAIAAHFSS
jgi:uroporphyrinogen III methyltransferase / synthase